VSKEDVIERMINEHQVADLIGVSVATVRRWRLHGRGPRYLKIGVLVRYWPHAVRGWLKARPTGGDSDQVSGKQPQPNAEQARRLADVNKTAGSAARRGPAANDLNAARRADRKHAVELWQKPRRSAGLPATKCYLYASAAQDKAEYYRWERGELPNGSRADQDIRKALLS
jgi:predicted DNA-binding transcriptional regulator AlpA